MKVGILWLLLTLQIVKASVFSGAENICSLQGCSCIQENVTCSCTSETSFQESFMFIDDTRRLQNLFVENCPRLVLPAEAISAESHLVHLEIKNVTSLEFHSESILVSRLREINIRRVGSITFQEDSLVRYMSDSPLISIHISDTEKLTIRKRAFARIMSFIVENVSDVHFDHSAFKVKVPTEEPTITLHFSNISTEALPISVFPSSFKKITIENSRVEKIRTRAFSGLIIDEIHFNGVSIQRIDSKAFSDSAAIGELKFTSCNISSMSHKSIVAGISKFVLSDSEIQSVTKHGAINATVATVKITGNRFKTLGQESFQFVAWDSVEISNNTFDFMEKGAINAIKSPSEDLPTSFVFTNNMIGHANIKSLVTQMPLEVSVDVSGNKLGHPCNCKLDTIVRSITGHTSLSSPFQDLTTVMQNTSLCKLSTRDQGCFDNKFSLINDYLSHQICDKRKGKLPACARLPDEEVSIVPVDFDKGDISTDGANTLGRLYEEFVLLFQVKTTKGILLFLLFCVLSCVVILTICVGSIWVHRLCRRAKLVRDNLSGSFQFNSGEDKQILYGSDQTTCHSLPGDSGEEEPTYAEIADVHHPPKDVESHGNGLVANWTTLPFKYPSTTMESGVESSATVSTTLPSMETSTLPLRRDEVYHENTECTSLLSDSENGVGGGLETTQVSRLSMSETSLTDEIMLALRDKLSDPNLYMSVLDAQKTMSNKTSKKAAVEDDLYCSPLYSDPLQLSPDKI